MEERSASIDEDLVVIAIVVNVPNSGEHDGMKMLDAVANLVVIVKIERKLLDSVSVTCNQNVHSILLEAIPDDCIAEGFFWHQGVLSIHSVLASLFVAHQYPVISRTCVLANSGLD